MTNLNLIIAIIIIHGNDLTLIFKCRDCHLRFENENSIIYWLFKQFKYEETKIKNKNIEI